MGEISIDSMRTVEIQANERELMLWFEERPFPGKCGKFVFCIECGLGKRSGGVWGVMTAERHEEWVKSR
jgi:hypothetical protein